MYEGNPGEIDFGSSYRESTVLLMMLSLSLILMNDCLWKGFYVGDIFEH